MDIAHKVLEELGNKDEDRYVLSMLKYVILSHTQCVSCCTDASSIGTYYWSCCHNSNLLHFIAHLCTIVTYNYRTVRTIRVNGDDLVTSPSLLVSRPISYLSIRETPDSILQYCWHSLFNSYHWCTLAHPCMPDYSWPSHPPYSLPTAMYCTIPLLPSPLLYRWCRASKGLRVTVWGSIRFAPTAQFSRG